jgi:hypothetical protein
MRGRRLKRRHGFLVTAPGSIGMERGIEQEDKDCVREHDTAYRASVLSEACGSAMEQDSRREDRMAVAAKTLCGIS